MEDARDVIDMLSLEEDPIKRAQTAVRYFIYYSIAAYSH